MKNLIKNAQLILPDHKELQYSGRIDHTDSEKPLFVYPASYVRMKCSGTSIRVLITNYHKYWNNYVGVIIDGKQSKFQLSEEKNIETYILGENLEDTMHDVMLFKRMDGCHYFQFHGFVVDKVAELSRVDRKSERRIEVYGDSVSAGEISEAEGYEGREDPLHKGEYSNAWYSYSWIAARELKAKLHDIAQGGIALMDKTGYFLAPNQLGMESVYDKLCFNPELGKLTEWNFKNYIPHVVIIAIGQNDSFPKDIMKEEFVGRKAKCWRSKYKHFISNIRKKYPEALIILTTTIMEHDVRWDNAIEMVCAEMKDEKIVHFLFHDNGKGTKGHVRIREAQKMGKELAEYINGFGEEVWRNC